jgi:phytoene desaturase
MNKVMKKDIVIIGSGLGGVFCGALLGREGYNVTILERTNIPGGRYTTLDKGGYKINTGAWSIGLHGKNGPVYKLLTDLGCRIETKVPEPYHAHIWFKDKDMPLPIKGQLRTIIDAVSTSKDEFERVMNATRRALRWQEASDEITCEEWLYQYTDNKLIHGQFDFFSRIMTATYHSEYPAEAYFRLLRSFGISGDIVEAPKNGQKATMDEIMKLLKNLKVEVFYNTTATQIVSEDMIAKGVMATTKDGEVLEINSSVVISDIGPKDTVKLAGESNFDRGYLKSIHNLNETKAAVIIFGYEKTLLNYQAHVQFIETDRLASAWEPCHMWPEYAPPGRHCLYTYSTMRTENTNKELEIIIDQCKMEFPKLNKAEIVATLVFKGEWPILRARPDRCIPMKSPIQGLYITGDAVNPNEYTCGEGIALTSRAIAENVKQTLSKKG